MRELRSIVCILAGRWKREHLKENAWLLYDKSYTNKHRHEATVETSRFKDIQDTSYKKKPSPSYNPIKNFVHHCIVVCCPPANLRTIISSPGENGGSSIFGKISKISSKFYSLYAMHVSVNILYQLYGVFVNNS